jgi:hypothetical protein
VISRPTTAQLLDDCAREVRESIAPAVSDPTVRVRLEMLEQILASCAIRAANEIAWLSEESAVMEAYAHAVLAALPDDRLASLLTAYRAGRTDRLDLESRVADYDRAGRAFAAALELAMAQGHEGLSARARELVSQRRDREGQLRPRFYLPGRS